jgi:hypothetical protein
MVYSVFRARFGTVLIAVIFLAGAAAIGQQPQILNASVVGPSSKQET